MFDIMGRTIRISRGDTGLIRLPVDGVTLTEKDLCVFTVKRRSGGKVLEKVIEPEDNAYLVPFTNEETEIPIGDYEYDVRIALDAVTDGTGRVIGGREIITPWPPAAFKIVRTVGDV